MQNNFSCKHENTWSFFFQRWRIIMTVVLFKVFSESLWIVAKPYSAMFFQGSETKYSGRLMDGQVVFVLCLFFMQTTIPG